MNSPNQKPYRDIPSALIAAITNPEMGGDEPNWRALLTYFEGPAATQGLANLQDFYLWVIRVGIPNAVIDNRWFLQHFYLHNPNASTNLQLRYDRWPGTRQPQPDFYVAPATEPQASPPNQIPPHNIFRDYPTPDGARFALWLGQPLNLPPPGVNSWQMQHRPLVLDGYLDEDELAVRQIIKPALRERTIRVLRIYWWLWQANCWLMAYQAQG
ncbi:hypothetical protein EK21DRAFT_75672 [Setomelanomma holmii]|uniref:Uncharacterized protein n=1 Tax=Setomelanomma holmii TaxID=210430 RepID=A0A9P4LHS0_9PLEO|nr:hypothetical protein EK21DRAFT_75672 [Setomelanomma holmii]